MVYFASLLVVFLQVFIVSSDSLQGATTHFGDIYLEPCTNSSCNIAPEDTVTGTLMVYYYAGSDMSSKVDWYPVCSDDYIKQTSSDSGSVAICNMLGYEHGQQYQASSPKQIMEMGFAEFSSASFALTGIDCTNQTAPHHLLRCGHQSSVLCLHGPLRLTCSTRKKHPLPAGLYEGSVHLCPPDQTINSELYPQTKISMGLVSVYHKGYYGTINQKPYANLFGKYEADSVCRQLGFTGAVSESIRTIGSYEGKYTFNSCLHKQGRNGNVRIWLTTDQAQKCDRQSCACFSCCYDSLDFHDCTQHCREEDDIIIECTFDISESLQHNTAGNGGTCTSPTSQVCAQAALDNEAQLVIPETVAGLAFFALLIAIVVIVGLVIRLRRFQRYHPVEGAAVEEAPQNGHED